MVRIKERYLLVNIVYPPDADAAKGRSRAGVPDFVVQRQPTLERLTPQALLKAVRAQVSLLFGDYGAGALEGHLTGLPLPAPSMRRQPRARRVSDAHALPSQVPVAGNLYTHPQMLKGALPPSVGGLDHDGPSAGQGWTSVPLPRRSRQRYHAQG